MYIAQSKRRENIAEYILYLWQLEDMLRALQFSPEAIYTTLIKPRGLDRDKEQEILEWYMGIAGLMAEEKKEEHGHLDHTMHLVSDLNNLHLQLMELPIGKHYCELYRRAAHELEPLRKAVGKGDISDIELFFRALYSVVLLRLKGDQKQKESYITDVLEVISPVIAELASVFRKIEQGEVDMFKQ